MEVFIHFVLEVEFHFVMEVLFFLILIILTPFSIFDHPSLDYRVFFIILLNLYLFISIFLDNILNLMKVMKVIIKAIIVN